MLENDQILVFDSSSDLANYFLKKWVDIVHKTVARRNRFVVALSGGRAPVEFYCKLASLSDFDLWPKVHAFMVDERFVDEEDPESNYRSLKENLFNRIPIPSENLHPVLTDCENVGIAAEQYKDDIVRSLELNKAGLPTFDLVLLGLGEDGHTASLFPDAEGIGDLGRLTVPVSLNHLKHERISLTLPAINNAAHVIFLVNGPKKADIVKRIVEEDTNLPAAQVVPTNGELLFLLDREASQKLTHRDKYAYHDEALSNS